MGTKIYNSDLTRELREGAKIQTSIDATPSEIAEKVIPVMEVNPKLLRRTNYIKDIKRTNAAISTMATTDSNKDTFITAATLSYQKDATATSVDCLLTGIIDGQTVNLLALPNVTLNAGNDSISINYGNAIKLDRNTNIRAGPSTAIANIAVYAEVFGYTVDNINA